MDLSLPQAILLLSLNDETGKTEAGYYQPALSGAAMADLFLRGTLELQDNPEAVIALRHRQSLGAFLGMCDGAIGSAPKPQALRIWIGQLATQKDFIATLADELCHLGALTRAHTKVFGLFTRTVWPEASPALEMQLKSEMAHAMFEDYGAVEERLGLVIALADAVDLLDHNFDPAKLTEHADRVAKIAAGERLSSTSSEAVVKTVKTAIRAANTMADSITATIIQ